MPRPTRLQRADAPRGHQRAAAERQESHYAADAHRVAARNGVQHATHDLEKPKPLSAHARPIGAAIRDHVTGAAHGLRAPEACAVPARRIMKQRASNGPGVCSACNRDLQAPGAACQARQETACPSALIFSMQPCRCTCRHN